MRDIQRGFIQNICKTAIAEIKPNIDENTKQEPESVVVGGKLVLESVVIKEELAVDPLSG